MMWLAFVAVTLTVLLCIKHAPARHPRSIHKHKGQMWE